MKNVTGFQVFVIAFVLAALLFGNKAHGAVACNDNLFITSASVSIELENRALAAEQRNEWRVALRNVTGAWVNLKYGDTPCMKRLRRYRLAKMDYYLTLGSAYKAVINHDLDLAHYLMEKAVYQNRYATRVLRGQA